MVQIVVVQIAVEIVERGRGRRRSVSHIAALRRIVHSMDRVIWDADSRLSQSFNPDSGRWSKTARRSVAQATFGMRTHQRCRQHPIPTLS